MYNTKRIPALFLALLLVLALAVPALAQSDAEVSPRRYSYIYRMECYLDTDSSGYAYVLAWADYMAGTDCDVTVVLEHNGKEYDSWSTSTNDGYIYVEEELYDLPSGEYQAIMFISCGSDNDTVPSRVKEI